MQIPAHPEGTNIYYYIKGEANSGKLEQAYACTRGLVEIQNWRRRRDCGNELGGFSPFTQIQLETTVPVLMQSEASARVVLRNMLGATIKVVYDELPRGI